MYTKTFAEKTYRVINFDNKTYAGKDSYKKRNSDYIIDIFEKKYFNNKTVLDLGCASGAILFKIKNEIKSGIGVDVDEKKIEIGKTILKENNIENLYFYQERLEKYIHGIQYKPDCVFLLNILHHLQDPNEILNIVSEISNDTICIEAPEIGFYNAYERDVGKEVKTEKLDLEDIINFLETRNYLLVKKVESENQENFIGPKRYVCLFQKKK